MVQQKKKFRFRFIIYIALIASVFVSIKDLHAQGRDRSKYQPISDTGNIGLDTSKHIDTSLAKVPLDSTARIKYFKYERKDKLFPSLTKNNIPFFLNKSDEMVYKVDFDSTDHVIIRTQVNNEDIKYPLILSFDKYIKARSQIAIRDQLYSIMSESYKIETQDELSKIFKNITDITIPLPFKTETIFGPPTINLKINGQIDITASYQKTSTDQQTISTLSQSQNNINFKQEVQVTAKGSIGDKLTIDADWNSQRTFDYENQLRLKYTGYPDEVVQSIEAGNVSLETKSNLIGSTQALFGIKGQFKLGPLTLTALASQKKSEIKEVDVTGGSQETNFEIPAYQYSDNHFFLNDSIYTDLYSQYYTNGQVNPSNLKYQVASDIEVWVQTTANNPNKRFAVCWTYELPALLDTGHYKGDYAKYSSRDSGQIDGRSYSGYFVKLNPGDFTLNDQAGIVSINVAMPQTPNDAVAVAYRYLHPQDDGKMYHYGTFANQVSKDSLVLVLVHYPGLQAPSDNPRHLRAWNKKIKSIYSVGVRNIKNDPSKFDFKVYYKPASGSNVENFGTNSYLTILGLDLRVNGGNYNPATTHPDGQFDFFAGLTVDLNAGEVIFPTLMPFYAARKNIGDTTEIPIDSLIYFHSKSTQNQGSRFYMGGKAIGDASSHYSLGFNLVQGSVKVYNGSVQLVEGVDYTVDYSTGELDIRNASALNAGSNLKITYESNDLFTLASKTLLGTRMEYAINKTSYVGFTLLNLQQQTLNDKVRIGEEPTNNTMIGFDAATQIKMNFLTSLIDKIPGYNTKEESTLDLRGELAYMLPDPNTKKSLIPSDNGESVAYLDDFEGAKKIISLGLNPLSWSVSSIPTDTSISDKDSVINDARCKFEWYNLLNNVNVNDVYPKRQVGSSQSKTLTPMVFRMMPNEAGMYTYQNDSTFRSKNPNTGQRWGGVFKYLNTTTTNLVDENIGFIEIWMKLYNIAPSDSARMMIDLGLVSEKIIPYVLVPFNAPNSGTYHTEDVNGTGVLDPANDKGIDGLNDAQEQLIAQEMGYSNIPPDPAHDDFNWLNGSTDFSQFNGTEGNSALSEGRRPDGEDLNGNGILDVVNNYFEYIVPIDSTGNNKYITGGGNDGWYQFRIPLNEYSKSYGNASLTNVQYIRVWFKGFKNDADSIKIVDFNLVGNQWQKSNKNDTSYSVSVVNIEDNSEYYQPPVPGNVLRQTDQTSVDQNVLLNEQSMSIDLRNLVQGQGKFAVKNFNTQPIDLLNYKIVKLFVNGDPSFNYYDTSNYDAAVVVRFGSDTSNFYEYRAPIHKDIRPSSPWNSQNEIQITLTDLTQVKQLRDSVNTLTFFNVPNGPPGAKYGIIGNPTLSSISQISLGVENNHKSIVIHPISGSVWFDELRVLKTDDRSGYAYNFSAALKVADFGTFNFTYATVSPTFHSLENRFGSRDQTTNWELSGSVNLHNIFNSLLASLFSVKLKDFLSIPFTFSHTESYDLPQYVPGTDIDLQTAMQTQFNSVFAKTGNTTLASIASNNLKVASQNLSVTNRIAVNGFKFTLPGDNYFIQEMLNKLQISYYWNNTQLRSPTDQSNNAWDMGGTIGMTTNIKLMEKLNFAIGKYLPLGDDYKNAKLYFFFPFMPLAPLFSNDITVGASFTRSRGDEQFRNQLLPNPTTRAFTANRNFSLDWKFIENWLVDLTGSYTFGAGSDLTYLETTNDSLKLQRSNRQIYHDIFFSNRFINFGKDLSYSQVINMNPKVNIPGLKKFLDVSGSYRVQYGWTPTLTSVPGNTAGYTADFQSTGFLKLNSLFDLFKSDNSSKINGGGKGFYQNDQNQSVGDLLKIIRGFVPDQVTITYSQTKSLTNGGILGNSGFNNFWVNWKTRDDYGPSRLYQLGWGNYPGPRAANIQLSDREGYANSVNISTFITPIFPNNLKISFTYKKLWDNTNQLNYNTDAFGNIGSPAAIFNVRDVSNPIFFPTTNIIPKLAKPTNSDPNTNAKEISDSFDKSIASFPFPSWDITLNGIEKFDLFSKFASSITFENSYSTDYKKTFSYNGLQPEFVQSQSIISTFSPLIGINVTFKELQGGTLTASFKLNKTNNLDLTPSSTTINNTVTSDFSINASYTKSGFKIPLFGLSLDNDLSIVFTYTKTTNDPRTYNYDLTSGTWSNNALNGSISTTLNPSIQYALSKNVSITIFYKYTVIGPSDGSIQIPTQKSNEAGLNLRLSIQ